MPYRPDHRGAIIQRKAQREPRKTCIDMWQQKDDAANAGSEKTPDQRHAPPHPAVEGPQVPERGTVVIDLGKHALDISFLFGEGADCSYACKGGAELLEDGGFGV